MSDLLIKGMDLPKKGRVSLIAVFSDGDVKYIDRETFFSFRLPQKAIELPPHGRLIDADRFMDDNVDGFGMNWDNEKGETIGRIFAPFAPVKKALAEAPTVLEASK